jgi:thiol-disulfide isomerase/thioredoxin
MQLDTQKVPRSQIAKIVWLHADEFDDSKKSAAAILDLTNLVQAVRSNGERLTFLPEMLNGATLSGTSDVLGNCKIELAQLDQLLLGAAIGSVDAKRPYDQWKLRNAIDPQFVTATQDGVNPNAGTESALVGKAAPDFELKLLEGGKFRLSEQHGQVIVLDFFATWCGPCVASMPLVDKAVEEFKDQNVKLVAVNLQEDAKSISGLLERLDIKPTVVLDQDGTIAKKYAVTGIPQTVIIDREGKIARLFIGNGPSFGDQLREALKTVLMPANP